MQRPREVSLFFIALFVLALIHPIGLHAQADPFGRNPQRLTGDDNFGFPSEGKRYALQGRVLNETGDPVLDAHVELRSASGKTLLDAPVGSGGWFRLADITPGWYDLVAISGVQQRLITVQVSSFNETQTIRLPSGSAARGESIVSVNALTVPSKAMKAFEKADRLFQKNDANGAWSNVNKALDAFPKFAAALTLRGVLQLGSNQPDHALADFTAALEADRTYQLAYVGMAAAYNLTAQFDRALQVLDRANTLTSQDWQAHFEASKALLGKQNFGRALQEANEAGNLLGHDAPQLDMLKATAYIGLKDLSSAVSELRECLQKENSGPLADRVRVMLAHLER